MSYTPNQPLDMGSFFSFICKSFVQDAPDFIRLPSCSFAFLWKTS